ncbi:DUF192 domain-containing protein [Psychroserpens mesophilus]|uniref:DUF192 domain-containing protein n=1 Tax=Psychroserpens mesophilus TaxID=325473 RepID=UPI003F497D32
MKRQWLKLIAIPIIGVVCYSSISCKEEAKSKTVKAITVSFKKEGELQIKKSVSDSIITKLDIEIADDDYSTQTGLMYRDHMDNNQGMLFIFPDSDYRSFYMKNTEIALDIIYISEHKQIVSIQKNAKPMDETSLPSEAPAKYVLEVNAGLSDVWNLEKGDVIEFTSF